MDPVGAYQPDLNVTVGDPVMQWLREKISVSSTDGRRRWGRRASLFVRWVGLPLFIVGFMAAPTYVSSWMEGTLFNPAIRVPLIRDFGVWNFVFLAVFVFPFSIGLYNRVESMFEGFWAKNSVSGSLMSYADFVNDWGSRFGSWYTRWLPLVLSVIITSYLKVTFDFQLTGTWHNPYGHGVTAAAHWFTPVVLYSLYMIIQFALRVIMICWMLYEAYDPKAYDFLFSVEILHPDGCGGLASIGNLALYLTLGVFLCGLIVALAIYNNLYQLGIPILSHANIVMIMFYLAISAFVVFMPVFPMHGRMVAERERLVAGLSREFEKENRALKAQIFSDESIDIVTADRIGRIKAVYDIATAHPTWPFNFKLVYTFVASVIPPVLVMFFELFVSRLIQ